MINLKIDRKGIEKASQIIRKGGIVVYPTESFYAIGADATNKDAVEKVFKIKGREKKNPILLIIANMDMLYPLVEEVTEGAKKLMENLWPGPVTIIFKASKRVLPELTAGTGKIGIRLSSNPVARLLSELSSVPITGTSANIAGKEPCKSSDEVEKELSGCDAMLDAGFLYSAKPTTVVDSTKKPVKIIRKGLADEKVKEILEEVSYA